MPYPTYSRGYRGLRRPRGPRGPRGYRGHRGYRGYGISTSTGQSSSAGFQDISLKIGETTTSLNFAVNNSLLLNFKKNLKCLGSYSEDGEEEFINDRSYIPFFNTDFLPDSNEKKEVYFDLNENKAKMYLFTRNSMKGLNNYLSWIISNKDESSGELFQKEPKFIFLSDILSLIMMLPNSYNKERKFYALSWNGDIYMLSSTKERVFNGIDEVALWEREFKRCLTVGEKEEIYKNCGYRAVLTSKLGKHNLCYSRSIDAVNPDFYDEEMSDLSACINFRCSNYPEPGKNTIKKHKMVQWCTEMALSNIPVTLVGYRNDSGIVKEIYSYSEKDLMKEGKNLWDLNHLFTFTEKMLSFVKNMTKLSEGLLVEFRKESESHKIIAKKTFLTEDFPPSWFVEEFSG